MMRFVEANVLLLNVQFRFSTSWFACRRILLCKINKNQEKKVFAVSLHESFERLVF